jgi:acyl-coenzyme A thioesterase PaaI-like protein
MEVSELPFNRIVGLRRAADPHVLELPESEGSLNHLGTVHASAQFSLAEATSGQFLADQFPELIQGALVVVRTFSGKFRSPARGTLAGKASVGVEDRERFEADLQRRGRATLPISVEVADVEGSVTLQSVFDWFVQLPR